MEKYTFMTQAEFDALFARLGLRVLASTPLWNPWIVRTRFLGRVRSFVEERLSRAYGVRAGELWELGGRYHPSPGATPAVVHPLAVQVQRDDGGERRLTWLSLRDALERVQELCEGHLRAVVLSTGHALGLLP